MLTLRTLIVGLVFLTTVFGAASAQESTPPSSPPPSGSYPPPSEPYPPPSGAYPHPSSPYPPPSGYYPPPNGSSMQCPDPSQPCGDWKPDPCHEKMREVQPQMEALGRSTQERMFAFQEEFAAARQAFSKEPRDQEAWRAFNEEWMKRHQGILETSHLEMQEKMKALLGECYERFGAGIGGPMHMPPPMPPMGAHASAYHDLPPPPMGAEGGRPALHGEAEKIRQECEAKARELGPSTYPSPRPQEPGMTGATQPRAGSEPMMPHPGAMEPDPRMVTLWRECEQRIRAIFERERGDHGVGGPEDMQERFGSLEMFFDEDLGRIIVQGRFVALRGNPESQMMEALTCDGARFIDRLFVNGLLAEFRPEETREGTALRVYDSQKERVLAIHDNPRCVINVAASGQIPSITLDLADHVEIEKNAAGDIRFSDGSVDGVVLLHGASVDLGAGNELVITGKATFLVQNHDKASERLGSRYDQAIEDKKVGAEIKIDLDAAGSDDLAYDATPMGDLETNVTGERNKVTVVIDSEAGVGKTVVLEFARDVFETDELTVMVEGVDGNGTRTQLAAREAESLVDALDPSDDGADGVEYWIVEDKNGYHVVVSFAHFSEKRVTVQSAEAETTSGSIPGFGAGLLVVAAAASVALIGLRRRN